MKKTTVSIGIPAFNEQANIAKLISLLLKQKKDGYSLKEIIIVSDKSTDQTVEEIRKFKSKKIILMKNRKRLGQAGSQNKIVKKFHGDVLVLLNADVLPQEASFISKIIKPLRNPDVGLCAPRIIPIPAQNFFEEIINFSIFLKEAMFENWNGGNNIYLCSGRGRAFSREFAKGIFWKESVAEDAYSYLYCIEKGYKFKYVQNAKLLFKSPDNLADHIKQSARFLNSKKILARTFDNEFIEKSYAIPLRKSLSASLYYLLRKPFLFISYIFIFLVIKLTPNKKQYANSHWQISISSKSLSKNL